MDRRSFLAGLFAATAIVPAAKAAAAAPAAEAVTSTLGTWADAAADPLADIQAAMTRLSNLEAPPFRYNLTLPHPFIKRLAEAGIDMGREMPRVEVRFMEPVDEDWTDDADGNWFKRLFMSGRSFGKSETTRNYLFD